MNAIDTGLYQDQIPTLSSLSIRDYERIFKIFEQSLDDKDFFTYNILKKIEFPQIDSRFLAHFTPPSKMAMSILSFNIYGDIKSWWIIYLLNKDKFVEAPFFIEGGQQVKYIIGSVRSEIYADITRSTLLGGRHF